jgi:hypothetical protein
LGLKENQSFGCNNRYTNEFIEGHKKKFTDKQNKDFFGSKRVSKYNNEFLVFLKNLAFQYEGDESKYLEYLENSNLKEIKDKYPDDQRYTQEFIYERSKKCTKLTREKEELIDSLTKTVDFGLLKNHDLCFCESRKQNIEDTSLLCNEEVNIIYILILN